MIVHTSVKVGIAGFLKALVNIVNKGFFRFSVRHPVLVQRELERGLTVAIPRLKNCLLN